MGSPTIFGLPTWDSWENDWFPAVVINVLDVPFAPGETRQFVAIFSFDFGTINRHN